MPVPGGLTFWISVYSFAKKDNSIVLAGLTQRGKLIFQKALSWRYSCHVWVEIIWDIETVMCDVREKEMHCSVGLGEEQVHLLSTLNVIVMILTQAAEEPTLKVSSLLGHQGIWTMWTCRSWGLELTAVCWPSSLSCVVSASQFWLGRWPQQLQSNVTCNLRRTGGFFEHPRARLITVSWKMCLDWTGTWEIHLQPEEN